jgi:polyisoprenoid-binding protein YceI
MTKVLHSADWMDVETHPEISFLFREVLSVKELGEHHYELTVKGDFQCKDVTKELVVTVKLTYLPDKMVERVGDKSGDLLVLRSAFTIQRVDFNIKPDTGFSKVANNIDLYVAIAGSAPRE